MEAKIPASHKAATLTRLASKTTETPCIGICSTIYGDYVCRGCFRSAQEVVDWNGYNTSQKLVILNRLNQTITQVLQTKLLIADAALLQKKCQQYNIKTRPEFTPYTWAHALLREGLHDIKDISKYGIMIQPEYTYLSLAKLIEMIDDELYKKDLK
jgi:predicted Fe-S protein YdhL (DUF1289 family)